MIPINLVFQMSDVRYEIKTSLPVIRTETLTENPGRFVSTNTNTTDPGSWLVDPVDDEDVEEIVHELILQL
jgi:hypothetical protein